MSVNTGSRAGRLCGSPLDLESESRTAPSVALGNYVMEAVAPPESRAVEQALRRTDIKSQPHGLALAFVLCEKL